MKSNFFLYLVKLIFLCHVVNGKKSQNIRPWDMLRMFNDESIGNDYSDSDKMSHLEKADLFVTVDSTKKLIGLGTINIATKPSAGNDYMLSEIDKDELTEYRQRVLAKINKFRAIKGNMKPIGKAKRIHLIQLRAY